jgi:hypothetical protein
MDPVRLRELIALTRKGIDTHLERKELLDADDILTCPDPLTLARAVEVMGREQDEESEDDWFMWGEIQVWSTAGRIRCIVGSQTVFNPTVGQFACLVLAAKQGVRG